MCGGGGRGGQTIFFYRFAVFPHVASTRAQTMYTERDINTCTSHCGNFGGGGRGGGRETGDEMVDDGTRARWTSPHLCGRGPFHRRPRGSVVRRVIVMMRMVLVGRRLERRSEMSTVSRVIRASVPMVMV